MQTPFKLFFSANNLYLSEQMIYGSKRIGTEQNQSNKEMVFIPGNLYAGRCSVQRFSNFCKSAVDRVYTSSTTDTYKVQDITIKNRPNYTATVLSAADYYAFGMQKPGRTFNSGGFRYAYNGMEVDPETKGNGNSYTTEFRQYDPRIGRWLSVDPLAHLLTDQSPYSFALNSPIRVIDGDGRFPIFINGMAEEEKEGGSKYWMDIIPTFEEGTSYKMARNSDNKMVHVYGPKSSGWSGDFLFVNGDMSLTASARKTEGKTQAKADADAIWAKLKENMKDGKITEQIQMVSHSKGTAFAEGYIEAITAEIQAKAKEEGIGFNYDKNSIVEYHIGLAPHQSGSLHPSSNLGTESVYVSHRWDILSDDDAGGNVLNVLSTAPGSQDGAIDSHHPLAFKREFTFILNVLKNGGGSTKIEEWYKKYDKNTGTSTEFTTGGDNDFCDDEGFSYTTN